MNIYRQHTHAHSVGWNSFHFEWCAKYRYKVFKSDYIKNICLVAITEAAKRHNIDIVDMEMDVDHVHVIANLPMTMPPTRALQKMKGLSSKFVFELIPNLRKRYPKGHLWSPGKFAASIGHITLEKSETLLRGTPRQKLNSTPESPYFSAGRTSSFVAVLPQYLVACLTYGGYQYLKKRRKK